ncbi:unnamed protein product [Gordionus sp. m RMFG-2023]
MDDEIILRCFVSCISLLEKYSTKKHDMIFYQDFFNEDQETLLVKNRTSTTPGIPIKKLGFSVVKNQPEGQKNGNNMAP